MNNDNNRQNKAITVKIENENRVNTQITHFSKVKNTPYNTITTIQICGLQENICTEYTHKIFKMYEPKHVAFKQACEHQKQASYSRKEVC